MEYDSGYDTTMTAIKCIITRQKIHEIPHSILPVVHKLYKLIKEGISFSKISVNKDTIRLLYKEEMKYPKITKYMAEEVYDDIMQNMIYQASFGIVLHRRTFTIKIGIMNNNPISMEELVNSIRRMVSWLYVANHYSDIEFCKTLDISLYFTKHKKQFPNSEDMQLGYSNINSGMATWYSNSTSSIIIFRYEEWFKVFVHECGHSYGIESDIVHENKLVKFVKSLVFININSRIGEAYVEMWARIIVAFYSAIEHASDYEEFIVLLRFNMKAEGIFSAIQAHQILKFMNVPYRAVIYPSDKRSILYKETTNIFAYYILCGSFMQDPFGFIEWCHKNNPLLMTMNCQDVTLKNYEAYIKERLYNSEFKDLLDTIDSIDIQRSGLRFTITDFQKIDTHIQSTTMLQNGNQGVKQLSKNCLL
jgi:hypothetical protein